MKAWLTLDSLWTYAVDGVPGCGIWVTEPCWKTYTTLNGSEITGWWSEHQPGDNMRAGKLILSHPEIDRIDREIQKYFVPDIDQRLERAQRFHKVTRLLFSPRFRKHFNYPDLLMTIDVVPDYWFALAQRSGNLYNTYGAWAQKLIDQDIPF